MSDTLKPCPFCGSDRLKINETATRAFVECKACKARGPKHESQWESKPYAVHNWNVRKREQELERDLGNMEENYRLARSYL